jgi:uncharacterized protein YdeI (YjbR/CyaY-like superfamily)
MPSAPLPDNAVQVTTRAQWRAWLAKHHARAAGVWLVTFKKAEGRKHVPYASIVEEALCVGWIDSKPRALDAQRSMLWVAPRKPGTNWSAVNRARVDALIASGQMSTPGQARVDAAKADGSWAALDTVEALQIPADLAAAFRRHAGAASHFDAFPRSTKRAILEWIMAAKRDETRATRVETTARLAAKNERANQWSRK